MSPLGKFFQFNIDAATSFQFRAGFTAASFGKSQSQDRLNLRRTGEFEEVKDRTAESNLRKQRILPWLHCRRGQRRERCWCARPHYLTAAVPTDPTARRWRFGKNSQTGKRGIWSSCRAMTETAKECSPCMNQPLLTSSPDPGGRRFRFSIPFKI